MSILAKIAIMLAACAAMEGVAWASHKYIMHGWGWGWHWVWGWGGSMRFRSGQL